MIKSVKAEELQSITYKFVYDESLNDKQHEAVIAAIKVILQVLNIKIED